MQQTISRWFQHVTYPTHGAQSGTSTNGNLKAGTETKEKGSNTEEVLITSSSFKSRTHQKWSSGACTTGL